MSNKDPRSNRYLSSNEVIARDRRDVELTFLKKIYDEYKNKSTTNEADQGDNYEYSTTEDMDIQLINQINTINKTKSYQHNPRISTTGVTSTNNSHSNSRMDNKKDQSSNNLNNGLSKNNNGAPQFDLTKTAIDYAVNRNIPPIKILCEPKVSNQNEGGAIIKNLVKSIEKDFKHLNPKHNDSIGFDSWYIDAKGDLCGITNDIELFIYLCGNENIPKTIGNTNIIICKPRNLPPQRSIIIKGVPNSSSIDDIKFEIMNKYKSIHYIDEIIGTNNGKSRFLRLDLMNVLEYNQILNAGVLCVDGQCLHVHEYLASPKVLFCSMCNLPGHTKRQCKLGYERCKRCGGNRKEGEHKECTVTCHNCKGEHTATDFRCPTVNVYRKELIQYLQSHPETLPYDTQIFIPSYLRNEGTKILGRRRNENDLNARLRNIDQQHSKNTWPTLTTLSPSSPSSIHKSKWNGHDSNINPNENANVQELLTRVEKQCNEAKQDYDKKLHDTTTKLNACLNQIQSLFNCFSSIVQRQHEMLHVLKTSLNEYMEISKIINQTVCVIMSKSNDQQYDEIIKQITAIPLEERQTSINTFFSAYSPLIDELTTTIINATEHLKIPND